MIVLSLVFMLMTLIVFIIYGLIAGALRELIQRRKSIMKNIERGFALSFAGLSIKLALEER
jgi:threonine/homoserine/homoserine lactone efflux protein